MTKTSATNVQVGDVLMLGVTETGWVYLKGSSPLRKGHSTKTATVVSVTREDRWNLTIGFNSGDTFRRITPNSKLVLA